MKRVVRYLILGAGLFFMGLGVALTTRSDLGTSPISSLPYVLSLIFPLTLGQFTFLLSLVFLLAQVLLLGRDFPPGQLLQVLVGIVFGLFIDLGMALTRPVAPGRYAGRIVALLLGNLALGLGVYLQVTARVIINPGEGVVRTLAERAGLRFGHLKVAFDATLVAVAVALSLLAFRHPRGVREGTLVSAALVGLIVNGIATAARAFTPTRRWLDLLGEGA